MLNKNTLTFLECDKDFADARTVLFGAPFDSTTSFRPGTRFGPHAVRSESFGLESYSPYLDRDLIDAAVLDTGDVDVSYGDTSATLDAIEERAEEILAAGKRPFLIGGEHLVTLGAVRAAVKHYPDLHIVHFDAHADLRDDYLGAKLSHACVIRRCHELVGDGRIFQFGIRSGERAEWYWSAEGHTKIQKFSFAGLDETIAALKGRPIYLTIDLDVLDPSCFPGTGTPEAGGVRFTDLLSAALRTIRGCQIVGCDMVELSPPLDPSGTSTATALKLLREMLLALEKPYLK